MLQSDLGKIYLSNRDGFGKLAITFPVGLTWIKTSPSDKRLSSMMDISLSDERALCASVRPRFGAAALERCIDHSCVTNWHWNKLRCITQARRLGHDAPPHKAAIRTAKTGAA